MVAVLKQGSMFSLNTVPWCSRSSWSWVIRPDRNESVITWEVLLLLSRLKSYGILTENASTQKIINSKEQQPLQAIKFNFNGALSASILKWSSVLDFIHVVHPIDSPKSMQFRPEKQSHNYCGNALFRWLSKFGDSAKLVRFWLFMLTFSSKVS